MDLTGCPERSAGCCGAGRRATCPIQLPDQQASRRIGGGAIATLAGGGVLLIFILQNTEDVKFHFLTFSFTWPLWLYTIVVAAASGPGLVRARRHPAAPAPQEPTRATARLTSPIPARHTSAGRLEDEPVRKRDHGVDECVISTQRRVQPAEHAWCGRSDRS